MSRRTVLITGASSGIGEAFADVFASERFDLVLVARREERLRAVAGAVASRYGVAAHVLRADLSGRDAAQRLADELTRREVVVDALVNNAGYGVPGTFLVPAWEQHAAQMQVMMTAVAELTYRLLPGMIARGYGRIINVASLAGLVPAPGGHTLYAASKAFVIRYSESLAHEVRDAGVNVTALCPGFTQSEFHDRTGTRDRVSKLPSFLWMDAATVARQGYEAVMAGRSVYINGRVNRTIAALANCLPNALVTMVSRRSARLYRK